MTIPVLVTRTAPAGEALCRRLTAAGWEVLYGPPIGLHGPLDPERVAARLGDLLPADRVIMTSSKAVEEAVRLVSPALFNAGPVIVPGAGTAATARQLGLETVCHPGYAGNSEAMLKLPLLDQVAGLRIVLLAAAGGRSLLGEALIRRGARVERVHVYRRTSQRLSSGLLVELRAASRVIVLISSGAALDGLYRQLPEDVWLKLLQWPVVVPSPRLAKQAATLGCRNALLAAGADDDAMIETLKRSAPNPGLG